MKISFGTTYLIIRRDGKPLRDVHGTKCTYATRLEAERWLMPGERVVAEKR